MGDETLTPILALLLILSKVHNLPPSSIVTYCALYCLSSYLRETSYLGGGIEKKILLMSSIGLFPHLLDKNNPLLSYGTVCDSRVILALKNATKKPNYAQRRFWKIYLTSFSC